MKRIQNAHFILSFFAFASCLLSIVAAATPKPESALNAPNLVRQKAKFFDEVYSNTNADFSAYSKVYVEPATIEFDDRWERDFRTGIAPNYLSYVFNTFPKLMDDQLKQAFGKSEKYQLVSDKSEAQLVLAPRITQFYINGPEFAALRDTFVQHVGRGKLEIVVNDTQGNTLAKLIDNRETRNLGTVGELRLANRARNYRDFRFLMQRWSDETVKYLN